MLKMTTEEAEGLALRTLTALTQDMEQLGTFLAETGLSPQDLRARLHDPVLYGCLLDYILGDQALLEKLASDLGLAPQLLVWARLKLPGAAAETYVGL